MGLPATERPEDLLLLTQFNDGTFLTYGDLKVSGTAVLYRCVLRVGGGGLADAARYYLCALPAWQMPCLRLLDWAETKLRLPLSQLPLPSTFLFLPVLLPPPPPQARVSSIEDLRSRFTFNRGAGPRYTLFVYPAAAQGPRGGGHPLHIYHQ
jgi:hypothetical protein